MPLARAALALIVLAEVAGVQVAFANQPPHITISVSERGSAAVLADGATIYDPTPEIVIDYDDNGDNPPGTIDPSKLVVFVNGTDKSSSVVNKTATRAIYQIPGNEAWSPGSNFVYASVKDGLPGPPLGYSSAAAAHVMVSPPLLSPWPRYAWTIGSSVTINGFGFDPSPGSNLVKIDGLVAPVASATATSLTFTIPSGAHSGDVVVTVDSRASVGKGVVIIAALNNGYPTSVAVGPGPNHHLLYSGLFNSWTLQEAQDDGTVALSCDTGGNYNANGLPMDSGGNLYLGQMDTPFVKSGFVFRAVPGSTTCDLYVDTTRLGTCGQDPNIACNWHEHCTPGICEYTESGALSNGVATSGDVVYTVDGFNGKIKRIDPAGNPKDRKVAAITAGGQVFPPAAGMAVSQGYLYFTSGSTGANIKRVPVPAGGTPTQVRDVSAACGGAAGGSRALAATADGKLVVGRGGCVSAFDPTSATSPFWDFWTLGYPASQPPAVALGADTNGAFIAIADSTTVYRIPKPTILVTDGNGNVLPTKIVVDYPTPTTACTAGNAITLSARFNPTTLVPDTAPKQNVVWTVEDPDDPSPDGVVDPTDPTGPTPDNWTALGSYAQWEAVSGFKMSGKTKDNSVQTEVVGNVTKIKFHPSCSPGDNYRIRASVTVPVYGVINGSADTFTVWRKLHVEKDSMGLAVGPFQNDQDGFDQPMGDVPDPILDFFAAAFKPAYIDVVLDTGQDNSNVAFKYNVPDNGNAINAQANLGRGAASSVGRWVAYVQGAYEGDVLLDNDPASEDARLGATAGSANSLTFAETVRDYCAEQGPDFDYITASTAIHEVGHQFGIVMHTGCIMAAQLPTLTPLFCSDQIRIIRTMPVPGK